MYFVRDRYDINETKALADYQASYGEINGESLD
jgi:hypothetical protein